MQTLSRAARISRIAEQFFSVQHFEKSERISGRGAFGVIVEIDVHVAVLFEPTPDTGYVYLLLLKRIVADRAGGSFSMRSEACDESACRRFQLPALPRSTKTGSAPAILIGERRSSSGGVPESCHGDEFLFVIDFRKRCDTNRG